MGEPPRAQEQCALRAGIARLAGLLGGPYPGAAAASAARPQQAKGKKQQRGLNENYARELMELHTLGVDGGYTQKDVTEVARVFTGWTIREPRRGGDFDFNERMHEPGTKFVLGHTIKEHGEDEGKEVLKMLAHHPATAHFISKKLAMRFVSDNPPEALVNRMAETFLKSDGDIRAGAAHHVRLAGILGAGGVSREGEDAAGVRGLGGAGQRRRRQQCAAAGADAEPDGHAAVRRAAADRLLDEGGNVGEFGGAAEPHEFRAALYLGANAGRGVCAGARAGIGEAPSDTNAALARLENTLLAGDLSKQTHETILKHAVDPEVTGRVLDDPARPVNVGVLAGLILGSPEFQKR